MSESIRAPHNTAAAPPIEKLMSSFPGGIEAQERQGQAELVNSEVLPTRILHCTQEDFEALGFVFGEVVEGDPIFRRVTLPGGWSRSTTSHDMWSSVVDERGIERVEVFYKAAFYDRSAHMWLTRPGSAAASRWIYGEDESPTLHPLLTESELRDALKAAEGYKRQAYERPSIYGDRLPRAESLASKVSELLGGTIGKDRP